ncbi:MAG: hypothetical protein R2817_03070 [Flavobacteriales bacterium]
MRFALVVGILLLPASLLLAQPGRRADPADLPTWMAELVTGEATRTTLKPSAKPVHTNAFVGTWIIRATGGKRLLYWGDEHRMIVQEVEGTDTPVRTTLVDLQANVSIMLYPGRNGYSGRVRDLYHPQQGYFLEIWSDSVVATGQRDTLMNEPVTAYVGTNSNGGQVTYWRTTAHPKLFADLQVWGPWLREGGTKYLSAFNNKRSGPAIRVAWDGPQYTPSQGEVTFHRVTPGKQPMPTLDLKGAALVEERLLWVNATQLGRLPTWMRERLNRLPPDSLPLAYTPPAVDRGIADNKFEGTLTARSASRWTDEDGTKDQFGLFTYWADERRAILTVDAPHEKGKWTYMVDLDHDVAVVSRNAGHSHVIPKVEISTLQDAGLVEFGAGVDLPFTPTGTTRKILGRTCELHTTTENYLSHYWFSDVSTPNPIHDMARWMEPKPSQVFKDLMFFGVKDRPMPFAVMATELTSFKPGKVPPPALDLSYHWIKDHRLDSHKRATSYGSPSNGGYYSGSGTESPSRERSNEVTAEPMEMVEVEAVQEVAVSPDAVAAVDRSTKAPDSHAIAKRLLDTKLDRSMNDFRGKARLKYTLINKPDTTEWIVDYASTHERMVLVRTMIRAKGAPADILAPTALLIDRKAGTETRYSLDRANSKVTAQEPAPLRTEHPPFTISPLIVYDRIGEPIKILRRDCVPMQHRSELGLRTIWQTQAPASLFRDLCSARKGWDGTNEYVMGGLFGLLTYDGDGMVLKAEWNDGRQSKGTMEVISLEPGAVDPSVFKITKDSWK